MNATERHAGPHAGPPAEPHPGPPVARRESLGVSEDWLATIVGLAILILIVTGVITKGVLQ